MFGISFPVNHLAHSVGRAWGSACCLTPHLVRESLLLEVRECLSGNAKKRLVGTLAHHVYHHGEMIIARFFLD